MKKLLLVLAIGAFAACNESSTTTEVKVDSIENKGDSLTTAIDSTTDKKVDSVKVEAGH